MEPNENSIIHEVNQEEEVVPTSPSASHLALINNTSSSKTNMLHVGDDDATWTHATWNTGGAPTLSL